MDAGWKYNGDDDVVKREQDNLVTATGPKPDSGYFTLGSSSEKEVATGEDVTSLSSPALPSSSLSQDQAASLKVMFSSMSGLDSVSDSGEGSSSPLKEVSRSQVSLGGFSVIWLRYFKISVCKQLIYPLALQCRLLFIIHKNISWSVLNRLWRK